VDGGKLFRMLIIGFQFPFLLLRNSERVLIQFPLLFYPNYTILSFGKFCFSLTHEKYNILSVYYYVRDLVSTCCGEEMQTTAISKATLVEVVIVRQIL